MAVIQHQKRILVAPLNWGLGHATRCIPIIKALQNQNFEPLIACDGMALDLLRKEFPLLKSFELPSYNIKYPKKGKYFKLKLLQNSTSLVKAIKVEKNAIASIVEEQRIDGIISDNRLGAYNESIPCVYVTHQLQVLSGNTTRISTSIHQKVIQRFNACWVPDYPNQNNLSGVLGHQNIQNTPVHYMGPISRFSKKVRPLAYDLMILLSGPEPQRSLLETKLLTEVKHFNGKVIFIKGIVETEQHISKDGHITMYNFMTSSELENTINESVLIVSRSGYTTIMDLAKLGKKAFFIPTPGQYEQEYLADRLQKLKYAPSCKQKDFSIENLSEVEHYKGFQDIEYDVNWDDLFSLFKSK